LNSEPKRILNAGCGAFPAKRVEPLLAAGAWEEVRLDVDPEVNPDVVGSVVDLTRLFAPSSFDAIWCSHVIEHLYAHEVYPTLLQFRQILKPNGFALIMCPDLGVVAEHLLKHGLASVAYVSPSGPIRPLDMIYGHSGAIEKGRHYMAHRTGFTTERLGNLLLQAGFPRVNAKSENFEIAAVAFMNLADMSVIQHELSASGFDFRDGAA
jgi:SAM-dependent methyltransferase